MIKKEGTNWIVRCDICSWNTETKTEYEAKQQLNRHLDINHKKPARKIKEKKSPVTDDIKQANLPEAEKPQGITKKRD
jgi:hypothetical protein